jgi:hypothetical protein
LSPGAEIGASQESASPLFSSTRHDRTSGFRTGFGSSFKTGQTDNDASARHQTPKVGYLQVGRQVTQGVEPPQAGHLQVGRQAMLDIRIAEMGHLQVGRMFQAEQEVSL